MAGKEVSDGRMGVGSVRGQEEAAPCGLAVVWEQACGALRIVACRHQVGKWYSLIHLLCVTVEFVFSNLSGAIPPT